ncbi:5-methylcytosine-specific restriction enzyme subunit McrC [Hyunsoonleella jejuensis]|uniref:5-methylcytosine-specific restriction enzyme subunit McrC n=1 Tax=Hyunsoonleella jejuensis TaxID=419940 RepID=A0A1H9KDJ8_9FLAO|nr:McrC family protein [Hyunsoonleella jejuensis]SEQ97224.1 5-methylcytosine-specific restriction enzyme subunit McrC [Hyunsoonleella jejuensis]
MSRVIQVFEFEKLTLHKDWRGRYLEERELDKLYEFNDKNNNVYFTGIRDGIKVKNYVGVIQIGGLTIEILPKTDKNIAEDSEFSAWHGALLNMLKICNHINVNSVSEANLKRKHNSLLDLYFEMYLDEVQSLLRAGLVKQYRRDASNVLALKGRLDFNKNIQQNLIHQERFYTEHQVYDFENLVNQILLKGLTILSTLTYNSQLKDRISRLRVNFPEIKEIPIQKYHFDKVNENRKTVGYTRALQIAKMIILNYSPDIRSGQENMLTLLFDMNKLWEEYVYRMLLRAKEDNLNVSFQNKQVFWEGRTIRPDLVLTRNKDEENEETFIIDTKWKILDVTNPKPSDNDLKQMYAYNLYWDAKRSMLLYPNSSQTNEKFGSFWKGRVEPKLNQCKVGFIDVLDESNYLNLDIGAEILSKLN